MSHTISIEYQDGLPAWRAKIVQPERFRDVEYSIQTRLFRMPKGALASVMLKLYDVPDQPYFVHRVMDLSDEIVAKHVRACADAGRMVLIFESSGEAPDVDRTVDLEPKAWGKLIAEGETHNQGRSIDGAASVEDFLTVFNEISRKEGVEAGWQEVEKRYELVPKPPQQSNFDEILKSITRTDKPNKNATPQAKSKGEPSIYFVLGVLLALIMIGPWMLLWVHPWAAVAGSVGVYAILSTPRKHFSGNHLWEMVLFGNATAALISAILRLSA
jgi:hypothetical protein